MQSMYRKISRQSVGDTVCDARVGDGAWHCEQMLPLPTGQMVFLNVVMQPEFERHCRTYVQEKHNNSHQSVVTEFMVPE